MTCHARPSAQAIRSHQRPFTSIKRKICRPNRLPVPWSKQLNQKPDGGRGKDTVRPNYLWLAAGISILSCLIGKSVIRDDPEAAQARRTRGREHNLTGDQEFGGIAKSMDVHSHIDVRDQEPSAKRFEFTFRDDNPTLVSKSLGLR
nr:hypothetical protein [Rhizobium sp. ACO-34A]